MSKQGRVRIGCSGWQYKHWRGDFYPPEVPTARWFEYYANRLGAPLLGLRVGVLRQSEEMPVNLALGIAGGLVLWFTAPEPESARLPARKYTSAVASDVKNWMSSE